MFINEYTDIIIEHYFMCPRNVGILNDSNFKVKAGDPTCGDCLNI